MKVLTEYLKFHTRTHRAYVHITSQVEEAVKKSGVKEGMVLVSAMHITAGVYVNDNESGLIELYGERATMPRDDLAAHVQATLRV